MPPNRRAPAQRASHLAHRVRLPAGHVVAAQRPVSQAATVSQPSRQPAGNRRQGQQVGPGHVADVDEVAALAAVLEHPRRHAVLQAGAEDRGHARVGGVARHPRAVHVVVAQPDRDAAGQPRPAGRQVLLRHLARGVGVARIQRRLLADRRSTKRRPAHGAARLEKPRGQVTRVPGQGPHPAMRSAVVGALAVHDHRGGEDQPPDAVPAHRLEQHRGAGDVDVRVHGQVGQVDAEPDHGGLVAHRVHPGQRLVHRRRVAHVALDQIAGDVRRPAVVHGRGERIQAADLVARLPHGLGDVRPDEAGRTGH